MPEQDPKEKALSDYMWRFKKNYHITSFIIMMATLGCIYFASNPFKYSPKKTTRIELSEDLQHNIYRLKSKEEKLENRINSTDYHKKGIEGQIQYLEIKKLPKLKAKRCDLEKTLDETRTEYNNICEAIKEKNAEKAELENSNEYKQELEEYSATSKKSGQRAVISGLLVVIVGTTFSLFSDRFYKKIAQKRYIAKKEELDYGK